MLPLADMRTAVDAEHFARHDASLGEIEHRIGDVLDIDDAP